VRELATAPPGEFKDVRYVLTDMDDTLTHDGLLPVEAYAALDELRRAGLRVIVVTAAPAGWCDQMARMWPIDGVIGENGGLHFRRGGGHALLRQYWNEGDQRDRLRAIGEGILARVPQAALADDQPFRLASLAFARPQSEAVRTAILDAIREAGLSATQNNLWLLGWRGGFDKLAMVRWVLGDVEDDAVCYLADSENDAPMFKAFRHTIGMSTVRGQALSSYPNWITRAPGGLGFAEAARAVLDSKT